MKTKKVLTSNLKPGMVSSEAAYTYTNHLVIQSNTTLTPEIIDKLKYYAVKSVRVYIPDEDAPKEKEKNTPTDTPQEKAPVSHGPSFDGPTYFERVQQTEQFVEFKDNFTSSISSFKDELNDIVVKNATDVTDNMLHEVDSILGRTRNSLHLLDMMQCLRGFDDLTYTHSMNVALICNVIGSWAGFSKDDLNTLMLCGLLHDIGKLKISDDILNKPDKYTDEEFDLVKKHTKFGYDLLKPLSIDPHIKKAALLHHERCDGSGYPLKATQKDLDDYTMVVAIADVYDAMTAARSYRAPLCPFQVIECFEQEGLQKYKPKFILTFLQHIASTYQNNRVLLSNGQSANIVMLNQQHLARPIVQLNDNSCIDLSTRLDLHIQSIL